MIHLTTAAIAKIKEISENEEIGHLSIRVKCVGGGCAGITHDMNFEESKTERDEVLEIEGITLLIDEVSFQYLDGVTIDWEDKLISSGFKFSGGDITGSCGCGKSVSYG